MYLDSTKSYIQFKFWKVDFLYIHFTEYTKMLNNLTFVVLLTYLITFWQCSYFGKTFNDVMLQIRQNNDTQFYYLFYDVSYLFEPSIPWNMSRETENCNDIVMKYIMECIPWNLILHKPSWFWWTFVLDDHLENKIHFQLLLYQIAYYWCLP